MKIYSCVGLSACLYRRLPSFQLVRRLFLINALCVASLRAMAAPGAPPADPTECVQLFFEAVQSGNAPALRSLLTYDFVLIGPDGRLLDASAFSESVASGSIKIEEGRLSGTATRTYGEAGAVTGFWYARGTVQGYRFDNELAFSALCVRQGGSWRMASLQLTARL